MDQSYEKLFAAVIGSAIHDACLDPIKSFDNKVLVHDEARSAIMFLWGGHAEGYCDALDINSRQLTRRLETLSEDRSELTISSLNPRQRRALHFNIKECRRLSNIK